MKNKLKLCCIFSLLMLGANQAWASTMTLISEAAKDGYVLSSGGANTSNGLTTGDHSTNIGYRAFLSFDLGTIPPGSQIESATLRVFQISAHSSTYFDLGGGLGVDHLDYGNTLTSSDYALAALQANIGTLSSDNALEWKSLDVSTQVRDDLLIGRSSSQFRLQFPNLTDNDSNFDLATFEDAENTYSSGNPPELVIILKDNTTVLLSEAAEDGYVLSTGGANTSNGLTTGDHSANFGYRAFLSFDLSALPSGKKIKSATLRVFQTTISGGAPYTDLGGGLGVDHLDYGNTLTTGDYALAALHANIGTLSSDNALEWKGLDVSAQVRDDIDNARPRSQFRLQFPNTTDNDNGFDLASFEDAENSFSSGNPPELRIIFEDGVICFPIKSQNEKMAIVCL